MSQIGNKLLAGFYATPERQGAYIRRLLNYTGNVSALDTTCGEGKILKQLTENSNFIIETYGVELEKKRAAAASTVLNHVFHAPIESMVISNDAFGLVYLNPPYDHTLRGYDETHVERKEYIELVRGTRYVKPGGILVYVIPSYRFSDSKIARHLATYYENFEIARFTDDDYSDYKQSVFIGVKKSTKSKSFNEELYEWILQFHDPNFALSQIQTIEDLASKEQWDVPDGSTDIPTFYSKIEDKGVYIDLIKNNKGFQAFKERSKPKKLELYGNPIINIGQGQMALLLASGAVNGVISKGASLHAVQGMENVSKTISEEKTEHSVITKTRTKREVSVKIITPMGMVKKLM